MVRSPLTAARATFALKAGEWFRRGRLLMVSPVHGDYRRCQAEIPLIVLFRFLGPALADFLGGHADLKTTDGHQRVVRPGPLPEREVMTGIGPVAIRQPRVRDREADATDPDRIRFSPSILPPYMRRSKSIETLLPILYLKGISSGDFSEALAALLGKDAAGLSASAIGRLKDGWLDEHTAWQRRDLSAKRYVYIWADGIHLQARLEDEKQCILVLIGATQ